MVGSRYRSSIASTTVSPATRVPKPHLEEWTTREKLCLASLAIKHNNSWNSVARHMQAFVEKDRPDGWSNQKTCAAQFDKLMNELGVDKRPKRNEPSDASSSVIYKKMAERRIKELEEKAKEFRKAWLKVCSDLEALEVDSKTIIGKSTSGKSTTGKSTTTATTTPTTATTDKASGDKFPSDKSEPQPTSQLQTRQQQKSKTVAASVATAVTATTKATLPTKANTSVSSEPEKPSTRALTRRESSRQNLEKTLAVLYKEASEIKSINQLCKPSPEVEKSLGSYDKVILKHVDMTTIKERLGGEVEDPHAVMNDFLLMFQNATMYYPIDHPTYKLAVELSDKLVPQWERSLLDRSQRSRH